MTCWCGHETYEVTTQFEEGPDLKMEVCDDNPTHIKYITGL